MPCQARNSLAIRILLTQTTLMVRQGVHVAYGRQYSTFFSQIQWLRPGQNEKNRCRTPFPIHTWELLSKLWEPDPLVRSKTLDLNVKQGKYSRILRILLYSYTSLIPTPTHKCPRQPNRLTTRRDRVLSEIFLMPVRTIGVGRLKA